jgi:hypothetical protein
MTKHISISIYGLILFIFLTGVGHAQQDFSYTPLKNSGPIPDEFFRGHLKGAELADVSPDSSDKDKKLFQNFTLSNNYFIYKRLVNGYVLYNTPVNAYINAVADKLLENNKPLRAKIRIYVVQSPIVNALTASNGMIFICTGLIAHLDNEAELASVLSHEITHYMKGHLFREYKKVRSIDKNTDLSDEYEAEKFMVQMNLFSREQEFEADAGGLDILMKSDYEPAQAITVFDMLSLSAYPYKDIEVNKYLFESKYLRVPEKYFPDTVTPMTPFLDYDDTLDTHPSVAKRKEAVADRLKANTVSGPKQRYLVSQEQFDYIRTLCRFELSRLFLLSKQFIDAFYNSYILLRTYPDNIYLKTCILKSLYNIQLYANERVLRDVVPNPNKIRGQRQKVAFLLNKLRNDELNAMILRMAWDIRSSIPASEEAGLFTEAITRNFEKKVSSSLSYFAKPSEYNDTLIAGFYKVADYEYIDQAKKKNKGKKTNKIVSQKRGTFANYVMADYLSNDTFTSAFERVGKDLRVEDKPNNADGIDNRQKIRSFFSGHDKNGKIRHLGISDLIVLNLDYLKIDQRRNPPIGYVASDSHTRELIDMIKMCAQKNHVNLTLMIPENATAKDSLLFADRSLYKSWFDERLDNPYFYEYYCTDHTGIQDLVRRYNCKYVGIILNVGMVLPQNYTVGLLYSLLIGVAYPPLLLYGLYETFSPNTASYLGFLVLDTTTGKVVFSVNDYFDSDAHNDLTKAELYNVFYKLSAKK